MFSWAVNEPNMDGVVLYPQELTPAYCWIFTVHIPWRCWCCKQALQALYDFPGAAGPAKACKVFHFYQQCECTHLRQLEHWCHGVMNFLRYCVMQPVCRGSKILLQGQQHTYGSNAVWKV